MNTHVINLNQSSSDFSVFLVFLKNHSRRVCKLAHLNIFSVRFTWICQSNLGQTCVIPLRGLGVQSQPCL